MPPPTKIAALAAAAVVAACAAAPTADWREFDRSEVGAEPAVHLFYDAASLRRSGDLVTVRVRGDATAPGGRTMRTLIDLEIDCRLNRYRTLGSAEVDAAGRVIRPLEKAEATMAAIAPGTIEAILFPHICR